MRSARAGFVLVDALMAVVLMSAIGLVGLTIGANVLQGQDRLLDRSVALLTIRQIAKEVLLTGSIVDWQPANDTYRYTINRNEHGPTLIEVSIAALSTSNDAITVSFLAPAGHPR